MYDLPHDMLDALKATPTILTSLLQGVSQEKAATCHRRR